MKKAKKIVALLLCAVLLIGASVVGTVAYLTSQDEVVNTFTVGQVDIELHETNEETRENGTVGLNLHLLPGIPVDKDPTVTVLKDSEDCYVRVKVTVELPHWTTDAAKAAGWMSEEQEFAEVFGTWATNFAENYLIIDNVRGFNKTNWEVSSPEVDSNAKTVTYILYYKDTAESNIVRKNTDDNTVLEAVFEQVVAPANLTNDQLALLAGMKIKVEAYAIQAEGFEATGIEGEAGYKTAEQNAWMAFDG